MTAAQPPYVNDSRELAHWRGRPMKPGPQPWNVGITPASWLLDLRPAPRPALRIQVVIRGAR